MPTFVDVVKVDFVEVARVELVEAAPVLEGVHVVDPRLFTHTGRH